MKKTYTKKQLVNLFIGLFFMFVAGWFCPTWGGITRQGVQAIIMFLGCIWLVGNGFGLTMPCLLLMFAMLLTGYMTGDELVASTLGTANVWQLIMVFVLLYALSKSEADQVLARWLISRKSLNGRPVLFSCVFMLAVTLMAALASALGSFLFCIALVDSIGKTVGYENDSQWKRAMVTGVVIMSSLGGGILPFKGLALLIYNLMASGVMEAGLHIDPISYMISAGLSGILVSIAYGLSLKPLFRVDFSKLQNADIAKICSQGSTRFNKRQVAAFGFFILGILYSVVQVWIPETMPGYEVFTSIGQGFWFGFMVCLMGFIHIDGAPLLDGEKAFKESVNWSVVLSVCAFTAMGGMIADENLGIRGWMSGVIEVVCKDMPFPLFVFALVTVTLVLTNFFSNTALAVIVGAMMGPFIIDYGIILGINTSCVIPAIVMSALCAYLTMAGGGSAPLYLSLDCIREKPRWVWTYGLLAVPVVTVVSSAAYIFCAYVL